MTASARAPIVVGVDGSPPSYRALDWGLAAAQRRDVVVVGNRGRGGFHSLLAGSVSVHTAAYGRCPVVVARPHRTPQTGDGTPHHGVGRVVGGVDGSELSDAAVGFAFREAAEREVGLTAVHCWQLPVPAGPSDVALVMCADGVDYEAQGKELLVRALSPFQERYPRIAVHTVVVRDNPAATLVGESAGAELLVVGSRGYGGFTGLLLGTVSHAAIHHAACPVAVVHR